MATWAHLCAMAVGMPVRFNLSPPPECRSLPRLRSPLKLLRAHSDSPHSHSLPQCTLESVQERAWSLGVPLCCVTACSAAALAGSSARWITTGRPAAHRAVSDRCGHVDTELHTIGPPFPPIDEQLQEGR